MHPADDPGSPSDAGRLRQPLCKLLFSTPEMARLRAFLAFSLCLGNVLSRPEPEPNLLHRHPSIVGDQLRSGRYRQGAPRSQVSTGSRPLGVATPRWEKPLVKSNKVGGREVMESGKSYGSHPSILLNRMDPAKQILFVEKFLLLNPVQQIFAYNQFFSAAPTEQQFAINQFVELDPGLLVRSVQAELDKMVEANPEYVKNILNGAQPELELNSAVVVKLPVGRVCREEQWVDGRGFRTLYRDCETGVVYNININVNLNIGGDTTSNPDDPVTVNPTIPEDPPTNSTTAPPTTEAPPCILVCEPTNTGQCQPDWFTCPDGGCVPPCRW